MKTLLPRVRDKCKKENVASYIMVLFPITTMYLSLGLQHGVIYGSQPYGLPLSEKIMPQWLKGLGYATHIIGKVNL